MIIYIFGSLIIILLLVFIINRLLNFNKLQNVGEKSQNDLPNDEEQMKKEYEEFRRIRSEETKTTSKPSNGQE